VDGLYLAAFRYTAAVEFLQRRGSVHCSTSYVEIIAAVVAKRNPGDYFRQVAPVVVVNLMTLE